ncbi:MAG: hypothetical protein KGJ02_06040 [Verrucomicrobiota bacterium]|nr:hypothetical protein [Verrucomicrobiota bacterium]
MDTPKWLLTVILSGVFLASFSVAHLFQRTAPFATDSLLAANTYLGPQKPVVGNPQLVRIEVLVRDSVESDGVQIKKVTFNSTDIPLHPRDVYGNRGAGSFQLAPGKYKLRWTVNRDHFAWPRNASFEEEVNVSPRDLWLQISIEGDKASIR